MFPDQIRDMILDKGDLVARDSAGGDICAGYCGYTRVE